MSQAKRFSLFRLFRCQSPSRGAVPPARERALLAYEQSDAIQLFAEREPLSSSAFELAARMACGWQKFAAAWTACRWPSNRLRRVRTLSVQQIAERLDDRFHLLTSGSRTARIRHQTLEAALDWSYELLSEAEQKVLHAYPFLPGGWSLEARSGATGKGD